MATVGITSLEQLRGFAKQRPVWHADIVQKELNGGKTTESDLAVLDSRPEVIALTVSGLDQKSFEYLVRRHGDRLTALHLWKCPRIEDFTPLESMPLLTHVAIFWNQRALRLWNVCKTAALQGLLFEDFVKLGDLDDLSNCTSLVELVFGNANGSKMSVETLQPLSSLTSLRSLSLNPKEVRDGRIQPLAALQQLQDVSFSSKLFTAEQIAWLRCKLPASLQSDALAPYRAIRQPLLVRGKSLDVLVNGYGKPFLSTKEDAARLERFKSEFNLLLEKFRHDPALEPQ